MRASAPSLPMGKHASLQIDFGALDFVGTQKSIRLSARAR
jgi:hypothetical protein